MRKTKSQTDDKTWSESHELEVIEDRTRTWTWFCLILRLVLSSFCYTTTSQDPGAAMVPSVRSEHWAVSLTWGGGIADQPVFRKQMSSSHLSPVRWEICSLLPSLGVWLILLFQPHLGGPGQPGAGKQTGVGGQGWNFELAQMRSCFL